MNMSRRKLLKKINAAKRPKRISSETEFRVTAQFLDRKYNPKKLQPRWLGARRREVGMFDTNREKAEKLYKWRKTKAKMNHLVTRSLKQGYVHPDVNRMNGFQEILFSMKLNSLKTPGEIIYTNAQKDVEWKLSGMAVSMKSREGYFGGARGFVSDLAHPQKNILEPRGYATDGVEGYKLGLIKEDFWANWHMPETIEDQEIPTGQRVSAQKSKLINLYTEELPEGLEGLDLPTWKVAPDLSPYACIHVYDSEGKMTVDIKRVREVPLSEDLIKQRGELEVKFSQHVALLSRTQRMETKTAVNYSELAAVALSKLYHEGKVELRDYNDINFSLTYDRDLDVLKGICNDERSVNPTIFHIARQYLDVVIAMRDGK